MKTAAATLSTSPSVAVHVESLPQPAPAVADVGGRLGAFVELTKPVLPAVRGKVIEMNHCDDPGQAPTKPVAFPTDTVSNGPLDQDPREPVQGDGAQRAAHVVGWALRIVKVRHRRILK